ncbi:OmpA family protein [Ornithobacterium rhinotracheale]|uniref:OmpA family protein n=1 Tax=Ornithobacterium rhinotracheale TaxID=28251 RepID=UPI003FA486ED
MKKIILASCVLVSLISCKKEPSGNKDVLPAENVTPQDSVSSQVDTIQVAALIDDDGNYIYDVGTFLDINLPDGTVINVGANSTESKLYKMLSDDAFKVSDDKTQGWITLDGVTFAKGSASLKDSSKRQIDNIAAILKAYPNAKVKFGGYTDNTGSAEANQKISAERAEAVMNAVIGDGIAADRLSAEGYGPEHPVCPANDTDVCKAQNRRVDLRVVQK